MNNPGRKELTPKQQAYCEARAKGMSKRASAKAAGYCVGVDPNSIIESSPAVQDYLRQIRDKLRENNIDPSKVAQVIADGLDAKKDFMGKSTDVPDHYVRHKFLQTTLKIEGVDADSDGNKGSQQVNIALMIMAERQKRGLKEV